MSIVKITKQDVLIDAKNLPTKTKEEAKKAEELLRAQGKPVRVALS